jgi:hypothetical protein
MMCGYSVFPAALAAACDWDWCTIAVFSCSAGCSNTLGGHACSSTSSSKDGFSCCEEYVVLVNEQECHLMPEKKLAVELESVADHGQPEGSEAAGEESHDEQDEHC